MPARRTVALLGDHRGHPSHAELDALIPQLAAEFGVAARWIPTRAGIDACDFDGVWLVPGSPYEDDGYVYSALEVTRSQDVPFLGTCGGMQYAAIEYLRNVVGHAATHAESEGEADDNAVSALACSVDGRPEVITPVPGTRFAGWVHEPFAGWHYCSFALTAEAVAALVGAGVVVGATAPSVTAEVLEFPDNSFRVASMFQPHIGASRRQAVHPLVRAFVRAVSS